MTADQKLLNITNKADELVKALDKFLETGSMIHKDAMRKVRNELKVIIATNRILRTDQKPVTRKRPNTWNHNQNWLGQ